MEVYELKPMSAEEMAAFEQAMLECEKIQRHRVYDLETHKHEWR